MSRFDNLPPFWPNTPQLAVVPGGERFAQKAADEKISSRPDALLSQLDVKGVSFDALVALLTLQYLQAGVGRCRTLSPANPQVVADGWLPNRADHRDYTTERSIE